ncbi:MULTISPECIES: YihY/virulence factor BrkB family protein [unclassified Fusibacter]|uniref:YihY/virulence factor BrkB family protein n=1 Tax=unclassified Fusibacter TaxID=2624464 RepID=UPI001011DDF2|nr:MULTISPECIES: YihY/virulence factor BrkB family protein [unclassified Fusibacter]MCK8058299.1 YihY/virulence factor BrkB family protein [Fusibacter sp. A2]NPE20882.1 YihY/virulence factor BrkB family protein [Fusibacter sp. A1]RXV63086.1 YihY/virulence factor BrkB family protein [Fusibacter sp. A1]
MTFIKEMMKRTNMHHVTAFAAQMAYFFFLSVFPFIIVFVTIAGNMLDVSEVSNWLIEFRGIPEAIKKLVLDFVEIANQSQLPIVSTSFLFILWSTSKAYYAMSHAFNIAYGAKSSPNYLIERVKGLVYTLMLVMGLLGAIVLPVFTKNVLTAILDLVKFPIEWAFGAVVLKWVFYVLFLFSILSGTYYAIPFRKRSFKSILPGTLFTMVAWFITANVFNLIILRFARFSLVYGTLASVAIAMIWLYFMSSSMIYGAEINALIEKNKNKISKPV